MVKPAAHVGLPSLHDRIDFRENGSRGEASINSTNVAATAIMNSSSISHTRSGQNHVEDMSTRPSTSRGQIHLHSPVNFGSSNVSSPRRRRRRPSEAKNNKSHHLTTRGNHNAEKYFIWVRKTTNLEHQKPGGTIDWWTPESAPIQKCPMHFFSDARVFLRESATVWTNRIFLTFNGCVAF